MEDVLKSLLDAELKAESLVAEAKSKHDQMVRQAHEDARAAEERFEARIPEIRRSFLDKEEEHASQTIAELKRRYEERQRQLNEIAQERMPEAAEAAMALVLDPTRF